MPYVSAIVSKLTLLINTILFKFPTSVPKAKFKNFISGEKFTLENVIKQVTVNT